jgi:hypothetical protein
MACCSGDAAKFDRRERGASEWLAMIDDAFSRKVSAAEAKPRVACYLSELLEPLDGARPVAAVAPEA